VKLEFKLNIAAIHKSLNILISLVWLINRLYCKILNFTFLVFAIFLFSCTPKSPSASEAEKAVQPKNTLRIFIENDSTILIAEDTLELGEIREYIANQEEFDEVHIHAEPETRMTTVYDLESICAEFGIPRLFYHALGDSLLARYQPPPVYPNNALIFRLSKDDMMMLDKDTLSNSEDLYPILKERFNGSDNPKVFIATEAGTSYHYYRMHEERIKTALAKIDTTLELEMAVSQGWYEKE